VINIRPARPADAPGIAAVHVASWRSTYAGVLPDAFRAELSTVRQSVYYEHTIRLGVGVQVAILSAQHGTGSDRIVGFSSARRNYGRAVAEGEVETLYVLDDWKENGVGRLLLRASARHLAAIGCKSAFAWVLRDNPSIFFYEHLGGKRVASGTVQVGNASIAQSAFAWDPIERLIDETV
jgi:L-amino acid N-acyltransferase YncA